MKKKKTHIRFSKQLEKLTKNVDPIRMTEAEAERFTKEIKLLHQTLLEVDEQRKVAQERFQQHSELLLQMKSELVIINDFMDSKGLSNEYRIFADLKQKGNLIK